MENLKEKIDKTFPGASDSDKVILEKFIQQILDENKPELANQKEFKPKGWGNNIKILEGDVLEVLNKDANGEIRQHTAICKEFKLKDKDSGKSLLNVVAWHKEPIPEVKKEAKKEEKTPPVKKVPPAKKEVQKTKKK